MSLLSFLVNHAEATITACALMAFLSWRVIRAGRVVDEATRLLDAQRATPDTWGQR